MIADLQVNAEIATALLNMVDANRIILGNIEGTGAEGADTYDAVVDELGRRRQPAAVAAVASAPPAPAATPAAEVDSTCSPPAAPLNASSPSPGPGGAAGATGGFDRTDAHVRIDVGLLGELQAIVGPLKLGDATAAARPAPVRAA